MATKTTIEMAREAAGDDWGLFQEYMPEIHRLAELVRADERARMATDKSKEAMKLALEAYLCREMPAGTIIGDPKWWVPKIAMAIREALAEQPAQQQTMYLESGGLGYGRAPERKLIIGYVNKSEQPVKPTVKQSLTVEPAQQKRGVWPCVIAEADFEHDTITLEMQCSDYKVGAGQHWLSTSPPAQRKPLTDEQVNLFINGRGDEGDDDYVEPTGDGFGLTDADLVRLVRRVEAAHGIKENK